MTEGRNNGTTEGQGESSIAPTFSKRGYKNKKIRYTHANPSFFHINGGIHFTDMFS